MNHGKSIHGVIGYVTFNRIPNPEEHIQGLNPEHLDPVEIVYHSENEEVIMKKNTSIHLLRICSKYMNLFKKFKEKAEEHITHPYIKFTSQRTEIVGTEMLFKNENQSGDVPDILDYFQVFFFLKKNFFFYFFIFFKKKKKKKKKIEPLN